MLLCITNATKAQTIYYVDSTSGSDASAGTSWGTAFRNVTRALAAANASTAAEVAIWVAHGTYKPTEGIATLPADNRDTSFTFYRGDGVGKALKVYGGFVGTEMSIASRDTLHPTYLDGNFAASTYSYHVAVIAGLAAAADSVVIDGFTILHGAANGGYTAKAYNGLLLSRNIGSGIYLVANHSPRLALRNCRMVTNYVAQKGGGLFIDTCSLLIENCRFISNTTVGYGAGMYLSFSTARIIHSSFSLNRANTLSLEAAGGAIYNLSSSLSIVGCTFSGNQAYGPGNNYGGAIYNSSGSGAIIDSCSFTANESRDNATTGRARGGAIDNWYCSAQITNCTFDRNVAFGMGGALGGPGPAYGGAVHNIGGTTTIDNCSFTGNTAISQGYTTSSAGRGYAYGGGICNILSSAVITNCTFTADSAIGRMDVSPYYGVIQGVGWGGGIYDSLSTPVIRGCTFDDNRAIGGYGIGWGYGYGYGGAIANAEVPSPVAISSCTFRNNRSANDGGGIFQALKKLTVTDCHFSNNTASTGGAIALRYMYLMHFTGRNNVFTGNTSTTGGGGALNVDNGGGTDTIVNSVFANNKDYGGLGGGGILFTRGAHFISNNTFYADSALAGGVGGAILVVSVPGSFLFANNIFSSGFGAGTTADTSLAVIVSRTFAHNLFGTVDPLFFDPANPAGADGIWRTNDDGLQLAGCSPARNAGDNSFVLPGYPTDIAGNARIDGDSVDMGAYETNPVGLITGMHDLCVGSSLTLSDTTAGGVWISKDPAIATITSAGIVTGVSPGVDTILYVVAGTCSTDTAVATILVHDVSYGGTISGGSDVCIGDTILLTASLTGGTWSASNTNATVVDGVVTGVAAGTVIISYTNSCSGGSATLVVTVSGVPFAGVVTGPSVVCAGSSVTLTASVAGGTWSVINITAGVSATGVVTGLVAGIDTVIYTVTNACASSATTKVVTVNAMPVAAVVSGAASVCAGSSTLFTASVTGGAWSATNSNATVSVAGLVTGVFAGVDTIVYTTSTTCGATTGYKVITVNPLPVAGTLSGPTTVCAGAAISLIASAPGGVWTATNANATVVGGLVTGVFAGIDTIKYTVSNICGSAAASHFVTVETMPDAGIISGPDTLCVGGTISLTSTNFWGAWYMAGSSATISSVGIVTGLAAGTCIVSYVATNTCGADTSYYALTVYPSGHCATASTAAVIGSIGVKLYPNPASETLTIAADAAIDRVTILNIMGQVVATADGRGNKELPVSVSHLPPGVYMVRVNEAWTGKFVKE